jgi:site-specific DNA-methyltransferase (adenine-specific)
MNSQIQLLNADCVSEMKKFPDKYFDLAVVDPPYGISINANLGQKSGKRKRFAEVTWDDEIPSDEYFSELFRVSKNQIVWGGNYFPLGPCKHFIFWDKLTAPGMSFADGEFAWTSFKTAPRKFVLRSMQNDRIHPTQKPVAHYDWIFKNYAKPGDKIIDTHLGSGSSAIVAERAGLEFFATEIDPEYFKATKKRFELHLSQTRLFL